MVRCSALDPDNKGTELELTVNTLTVHGDVNQGLCAESKLNDLSGGILIIAG